MSTAKVWLSASMLGLLLAAAPALAQSGLRLDEDGRAQVWPRWQARLGVSTNGSVIDADTRWQVSAGQLLGDYYWSGLRPAVGASRSGGFRATSGLLLGQRSLALGTPTLSAAQGMGLTLSRNSRMSAAFGEAPTEPWTAVPYFGIGYSGISLRGGWGFTADVGLAGTAGGLSPRPGLQGVDELLRELRLTPVLQIGASYAF